MFTEDDEVQMTRKIYGLDVYFGIVKKEKLSLIDKIKKLLNIADEWIDYRYKCGFYDTNNFYDFNINPDEFFLEIVDKKYNIKNSLWNTVKSLGKNFIKDEFTIYGVLYGKNVHLHYNYGLETIEFVGCDIFENKNYVAPDAVKLIFDNQLNLPHIEILHTGEWSKSLQEQYSMDTIRIDDNDIPHAGIVIKHVSGDRNKIETIYNPKFRDYIEKHR